MASRGAAPNLGDGSGQVFRIQPDSTRYARSPAPDHGPTVQRQPPCPEYLCAIAGLEGNPLDQFQYLRDAGAACPQADRADPVHPSNGYPIRCCVSAATQDSTRARSATRGVHLWLDVPRRADARRGPPIPRPARCRPHAAGGNGETPAMHRERCRGIHVRGATEGVDANGAQSDAAFAKLFDAFGGLSQAADPSSCRGL
jgi:hypothetical protein